MERIKQQLVKTISEIGDKLSAEGEGGQLVDNMNDRVVSSYEAPSTSEETQKIQPSSQNSTPKRKPAKLTEEEEIINSIDAAYFINNDDFDAINYELLKLPDIEMCYEDIQRERPRLKTQHTVVSKKISSLIMQKAPSYSSQVGEMKIIENDIGDVLVHVRNIRRSLDLAKTQTRTCLGLIANKKKRTDLTILKETLKTLKIFYESEQNVREEIQRGNFPLAIQLIIETQILGANYKCFTCVNAVMEKLTEISGLIETELCSQLSTIAVVYDHEKYNFVYTAYEMLEKTSNVTEKLQAAFRSTIETTTEAVVMEKLNKQSEELKDATYASLCLKLDNDQTATAFRETGFVVSRTFHSFHNILRFHSQENSTDASTSIYKQLLDIRQDIFDIAVRRILGLVESRDFCSLKFDQILEIVDMINRFNKIGKMYFSYTQKDLVEAIEKRISIYFDRYHRERMDELIMFIENESFALCPVPYQFTIFDLQDFEFLKESRQELDHDGLNADDVQDSDEIHLMSSVWINPFSQAAIKSRHQSTYSQKSDSGGTKSRSYSTNSEYGLKSQDSFAEDPLEEAKPDPNVPPPPNLCNTALNVLRYFGRYIRMTALLPTICDKSAPAIMDLYEFYFASICNLFGSEGAECVERIPRLANCLDLLGKKFLKNGNHPNSPFKNVFRAKDGETVTTYPSLCPAVQIAFIDNLYGACERIIAIDSIEFVARQLDLIRPVIESLLLDDVKEQLHSSLDQFYTQVLPASSDARILIIDASASRSLRLKSLIENVISVKWDINELKSQHSPYVDTLVQDYELFSIRLNNIKDNVINITDSVHQLFWQRTIYYSFKALVQGYGDGGKCSTEGRALMQLDFQNILIKLEGICGMKPIPHAEFVDSYIKAYYLPETGLEQWIKTHSEYSSKQLTSLLGAAAHVSKKARVRILDALKD